MHNDKLRQELIDKYDILDSPNEIQFDRLTEGITKEIGCFGATISIVSQNRVWFKSKYGILRDEINSSSSLSRELVLSQNPFFNIENFGTDGRYKDHYNHTSLLYKFFAAAPIELEPGIRVGALCIFDFAPKKLTSEQLSYLQNKANHIAELLKSGKGKFNKLSFTHTSEEELFVKKTSGRADFGGFYADATTNTLRWNPSTNFLLNLNPGWSPQFNDLINPDFTTPLRANNDVFKLFKEIQVLIRNKEITQYSHLYTLNFGLPRNRYIHMIYHRSENDIYVVLKNESNLLEVVSGKFTVDNFPYESESLSEIGGWEYDLVTKNVFMSRKAAQLLSIPWLQEIPLDSMHLDQRILNYKTFNTDFILAINKGKEYIGYHTFRNEGKPSKTIRIKGIPIVANQHIIRIKGTIQDLTGDKIPLNLLSNVKTENKKQQYFYDTILNNKKLLIFELSSTGQLVYSNSSYNRVFTGQHNAIDLIGRDELLQYSEDNQSKIRTIIRKCLQFPGISFPLSLEREDPSGRKSIIAWDCCSIGKTTETTPTILFIGIDVTTLEKNKVQLLELIDKVTLQNDRSIEFGNIINHHVRSQVANLQGLVQLMELMNSPEDKMEYFSHLRTTVSNLLEITHIVTNVLHLQNNKNADRINLSLEELLDSIITGFWKELIDFSITLDIQLPEGFRIFTVENYLKNIIKELIKNAIRFRKPDTPLKITIKASRKESSSLIIISDNGVGIDLEAYKDRLFKLYDAVTPTPDHKGTGLYMTRVRVSALGGTIKVKSSPSLGTSFYIELPDETH